MSGKNHLFLREQNGEANSCISSVVSALRLDVPDYLVRSSRPVEVQGEQFKNHVEAASRVLLLHCQPRPRALPQKLVAAVSESCEGTVLAAVQRPQSPAPVLHVLRGDAGCFV